MGLNGEAVKDCRKMGMYLGYFQGMGGGHYRAGNIVGGMGRAMAEAAASVRVQGGAG